MGLDSTFASRTVTTSTTHTPYVRDDTLVEPFPRFLKATGCCFCCDRMVGRRCSGFSTRAYILLSYQSVLLQSRTVFHFACLKGGSDQETHIAVLVSPAFSRLPGIRRFEDSGIPLYTVASFCSSSTDSTSWPHFSSSPPFFSLPNVAATSRCSDLLSVKGAPFNTHFPSLCCRVYPTRYVFIIFSSALISQEEGTIRDSNIWHEHRSLDTRPLDRHCFSTLFFLYLHRISTPYLCQENLSKNYRCSTSLSLSPWHVPESLGTTCKRETRRVPFSCRSLKRLSK